MSESSNENSAEDGRVDDNAGSSIVLVIRARAAAAGRAAVTVGGIVVGISLLTLARVAALDNTVKGVEGIARGSDVGGAGNVKGTLDIVKRSKSNAKLQFR